MRQLVGVAEIAGLLGVSRQRADALTRRKGFPDPLTRVLPVDEETAERLRVLFATDRPEDIEDALDVLWSRAFALPEHPRLWRLASVEAWAEQEGRHLDGGRTGREEPATNGLKARRRR